MGGLGHVWGRPRGPLRWETSVLVDGMRSGCREPAPVGCPHIGGKKGSPVGWGQRGLGAVWGGERDPSAPRRQRSPAGIRLARRRQLFLSRSKCLHGTEQGNEESCREITSLMGSPLRGDAGVWQLSGEARRRCGSPASRPRGPQHPWVPHDGSRVPRGPCPQPCPAGRVCSVPPHEALLWVSCGEETISQSRQPLLCPSSSSSSLCSRAPCYLIGFGMLESQSPSGLCCALAGELSQLSSAPWQPTSQ